MRLAGTLWLCFMVSEAMADPALAPAPREQREQIVLIQGKPAGNQVLSLAADGSARAEYQYSDRGRGDRIQSQWTLDAAAGVPADYTGTGHNYLKVAVDERFRLNNGQASWKNSSEQGEQTLTAPAFYLPMNAPPEIQGVLARALLKAPGHKLALLPAGEARLDTIGKLDIAGKKGPAALTLHRITGLNLTPDWIWLDGDGSTAAQLIGSG